MVVDVQPAAVDALVHVMLKNGVAFDTGIAKCRDS